MISEQRGRRERQPRLRILATRYVEGSLCRHDMRSGRQALLRQRHVRRRQHRVVHANASRPSQQVVQERVGVHRRSSRGGKGATPVREPVRKVDQLAELTSTNERAPRGRRHGSDGGGKGVRPHRGILPLPLCGTKGQRALESGWATCKPSRLWQRQRRRRSPDSMNIGSERWGNLRTRTRKK